MSEVALNKEVIADFMKIMGKETRKFLDAKLAEMNTEHEKQLEQRDQTIIKLMHELGDMHRRFEAIEMKALSSITYQGTWTADREYMPGDTVTHSGSLYIAMNASKAKPGETDEASRDWKMAVRRPADGKSAYELARKAGLPNTRTEREWLQSLSLRAQPTATAEPRKND